MKTRLLTGLLSLLMPAMVLAGEYNLTVDRVEIDTGAYATGRLTAAEISGEGIRFHST